jgi:hypothetical protein
MAGGDGVGCWTWGVFVFFFEGALFDGFEGGAFGGGFGGAGQRC